MRDKSGVLADLQSMAAEQPQIIFLREEGWEMARQEMCEAMERCYGVPMPFVDRELEAAGVPHFLFRMVPVVPI